MGRIKIGVMGCADVASRLVIPAIKSCGRFELVAIASRSAATAEEFAGRFGAQAVEGYNSLLEREDLDAVYSPLPCGLQYEWINKALKSGKHVIAEKSLSDSYANVKSLVETAKAGNLVLFENFMFRHHHQLKFVHETIDSNEIGKVRLLRSSFGFPPFDSDNIRYKKELGGGALLDAGAYTIMATQLFLGHDLSVLCSHLDSGSKEVDIFGSAMLKNSEGTIAQLAFGFDNFYQCSIEFWGTEGKLTMERAFTAGPTIKPKIVVERQGGRKKHILDLDNHFENILIDFFNKIESDGSMEFDGLLNQARLIEEVRIHAGN